MGYIIVTLKGGEESLKGFRQERDLIRFVL